MLIIWIYSTVCLFLIGIGGSFYIQSIPMKNNGDTFFIKYIILYLYVYSLVILIKKYICKIRRFTPMKI